MPIPLPPGAKLIDDESLPFKLPPGAKMVGPVDPVKFKDVPNSAAANTPMSKFEHSFTESVPSPGQFARSLVQGMTLGQPQQEAPADPYAAYKHPGETIKNAHFQAPHLKDVPIIGQSLDDLSNGAPAEALGHIAFPVLAAAATHGVGRGMRGLAPGLAKSSLGIKGDTEAYGANPGKAILEETSGVRPDSIAKSAKAKINELVPQRDAILAKSPAKVDLQPARDAGLRPIAAARAANSVDTPRQLQPMVDQLTEARPGFQGSTSYPPGAATPISFNQTPSPIIGAPPKVSVTPGAPPPLELDRFQPPTQAVDMRQHFNKDFIRNWNPASNTQGQLGVARDIYGNLTGQIHAAVPESAPLDNRISSLIPVAKRARLTDLQADLPERLMHKATTHTGALTSALIGLHEAGPAGAVAGFVGPELMNSPSVKMIGARTLHGVGNALASPVTAGALALSSAARKREAEAGQ